MFRKNKKHLQTNLFGIMNIVSAELAKEIQGSEEQKFYEIIFCNIKEEDFACLYSESGSRPNVPVNCLVSSILLQHRYNLTYERLFENIKFNLLTKTALGLQRIEEIPFTEATLFNFQNRVIRYFTESGINLLEKVFDHLTETQIKELKIKTDIQRTDSFQAASNVRRYTRLQLLIEMVIRIYRVISQEDREKYAEQFSEYIKKTSGQYIYRLESEKIQLEFEKIGILYKEINDNLKPKYKDIEIFKIFERVYEEHFTEDSEKIIIKPAEELTSSCVQSPDDIEATYRKKNNKQFTGQTINIVETCNPDNQINLITDISVHTNNKDDSKELNERIEIIKEKNPEITELHHDGAYSSKENDKKLETQSITAIQTAIRGRGTEGIEVEIRKEEGDKYIVSCPKQEVEAEKTKKRLKAEFAINICTTCEYASICQLVQNKTSKVYYFTEEEYQKKQRMKNIKNIPMERRGLRTNIEATVSEFTRKMNNHKLRVRGSFKTKIFAFAAGIGINFGRIYRYLSSINSELRFSSA